jgi:putative flippase GtrA
MKAPWLGQGLRFAITGAGVAGVYLLATLLLADVVGLPFQVALAIGLVIAVTTHFLAQRFFVWSHDGAFALPVQHQAGRYLAITLVQYGLTALSTAVLPTALGVERNVVYVATVACLTGLTFLLLRAHVFHPEHAARRS